MGYRSPERVKKLNMDSGLGALQAITEFLSMGVENTRNDANQWVQGANQTISSIDSAGTSKQFEELERLIDDYMDIGQEYTDILGDESYHAKALELQNKLNQKQGVLGRFENNKKVAWIEPKPFDWEKQYIIYKKDLNPI